MAYDIYENYSVSGFTTLKIGGNAELAYFPSNIDEFKQSRNYLIENDKQIIILGAGSNVLISSNGISGGVIFTNNLKNCEFLDETTIKVDSGMKSANLAKILCGKELAGLEFLIGIPGSIGGAVTMNSSAHGQSIKDVIQSVEVFNIQTGEISSLDKAELMLDYRDSFVKANTHLILNATFKLEKGNINAIKEKMDFHLTYRRENHPPLNEPNAGSTFRNPERKVYVGRLLEDLNAKTWQEGGAKISSKHANFIINTGNATSLDVSRLMYRMYKEVKDNYGYDLIAEIRFVGNYTEEEREIWANFQVH